ncbi:MAG TPA: hypothetical protein DCQ30_04855, partial [Acidimicrobiaceae bacterium]|nr:hypothetical protein [Acidimicrobiaceae bacterium]
MLSSLTFAGSAGADPADCTPTSTSTSGTCTLYTPNGTFHAGGTLTYAYDAAAQQLTITLSGLATISQGPWLCIGPSDMNAYLDDPANVCTPNGVLVTGTGDSQVFPVSNPSADTFVFDVPLGDFWFVHVVATSISGVSGENSLEATAPAGVGLG